MANSVLANRKPRSLTSKCAHVIERFGLAMAGASCGLFVAAHISNARVEALGSVGFILTLMILGAIGFYLGIDVPPHRSGRQTAADDDQPPTDPVELLSAAGTFLAAAAAFLSVYIIVVDAETSTAATTFLAACWLLGVTMQIAAGMTARLRKMAD